MRLPRVGRMGVVLPALAPTAAIVGVMLSRGTERGQGEAPPALRPVEMPAELTSMNVTARPSAASDVARAARERVAALTDDFDMDSPFFFVRRQEPGQRVEAQTSRQGANVSADLTSLMDTPRGAIAVINGRPCRVGDRVGDAATIEAIDVVARTVTARLDAGGTLVLTLATPGDMGGR